MKLERLHESVLPFVVIAGGLGLALYAGLAAGGGRFGTIFLIIAVISATAFVLVLRERVWMMIPLMWVLSGKVAELPLPFSIAQLGVMFSLGVFLILKALKVIRIKPKSGIAELWILVMLTYLMTVFLRNPVGFDALGSDRVGGRPYFDICIAYAGLWVLSRAVATPLSATLLPCLVVGANGLHTFLNVVANNFPWTIGPLSRVYSGIAAAESAAAGGEPAIPDEGGRFTHFQGLGASMYLAAVSFWRPSTLINPFFVGRFLMLIFSVFSVLLAGYRSTFLALIVYALLSSYFRRGTRELLSICFVGVFSLAVLVLLQGTVIQLPYAAQRALSFLPGNWDYMAKLEAQNSTEWRVEMWKTMMASNKYIENKWLGDGFGFTKGQLQIMAANAQTGSSVDQRENLMINGNVHSGPITTIRYAGYVGLTIYMILLFIVAWRAVTLIRLSKGTPFFACALFFGLPAIYHPLNFVLIFGAFDLDLPTSIINVGLLRMLDNSLEAYAQKSKSTEVSLQPTPKLRQHSRFVPATRNS